MICPRCSTENPSGSAYCFNCGQDLNERKPPDRLDVVEFGSAVGRECVRKGRVLGKAIFFSHGFCATASTVRAIEGDNETKLGSFTPYSTASLRNTAAAEDDSSLLAHCLAAGVGFVLYLAMAACDSLLEEVNRQAFVKAMGRSASEELEGHFSGVTFDLVLRYNSLPMVKGLTKRPKLNIEKPGMDDVLAVLLEGVSEQIGDKRIAFQRWGAIGFADTAIRTVTETAREFFSRADKVNRSAGQTSGARFELSKEEMVCILFSFCVSGKWDEMNLSEKEAQEWLLNFIRGLQDHTGKAVKSIFGIMQNTLMAHRKDSFDQIQQEPFFWPSALRNSMHLDAAFVAAGDDGFRVEWKKIFSPGWKTRSPAPRLIAITGGSGNSAETALVINAPEVETRVAAEYWYLYYTYGRGWSVEVQKLIGQCDVLQIVFPDGRKKTVFFDRGLTAQT